MTYISESSLSRFAFLQAGAGEPIPGAIRDGAHISVNRW